MQVIGAKRMWREQLDYFWDGRDRLTIGRQNLPPGSVLPHLTIVSASDESLRDNATLVDVIDVSRWSADILVVVLSEGHRFLRLTSGDGKTVTIRLVAESDFPAQPEIQLLMAREEKHEGDRHILLELKSVENRGDGVNAIRQQIAQQSSTLLWAISQSYVCERFEANDWLLWLGPATRVYPSPQTRITILPQPLDLRASADMRQAPFSIMQHWLNENGAPRAIIQIRLPQTLEDNSQLLRRVYAFIAMRQRQRLDIWNQLQKLNGAPQIDPLNLTDLRTATGRLDECPDAVGSDTSVSLVNLLRLIVDPEKYAGHGVAVRRLAASKGNRKNGEIIEVDFFAAALGDDVGLVYPTAMLGDLLVTPIDPGGPEKLRLLRFSSDGLHPLRAKEDDPLVGEIINQATRLSQTASLHSQLRKCRERFTALLNKSLAEISILPLFDELGSWEGLDPLIQLSYARLLRRIAPMKRQRLYALGGYLAYAADPGLVTAVATSGTFSETESPKPLSELSESGSLLQRYLAACDARGMSADTMTLRQQARALLALKQDEGLLALRQARISLPDEIEGLSSLSRVAHKLNDRVLLRRALNFFEQRDDKKSVAEILDYLSGYEQGLWLPPDRAEALENLLNYNALFDVPRY
ncbi:MAG: hypothetical protein EBS82_02930 [Methylocystaceae bacterium]|jgi:hypothetical protein|nr:hypothetical protein [Methylocystaceae bacterium]